MLQLTSDSSKFIPPNCWHYKPLFSGRNTVPNTKYPQRTQRPERNLEASSPLLMGLDLPLTGTRQVPQGPADRLPHAKDSVTAASMQGSEG